MWDRPSLELKPGKHEIIVETETIDTGENQTWGVIVIDEGGLPMRHC